jgi:acetyltransferase
MHARIAEAAPDARLLGFTVQAMARRPGAFELIAGVFEDPQFGPVVLFGEGGTGVEAIGDIAMALPPLDAVLAGDLIAETRIGRLLPGYRGRSGADMDAVADALIRVSRLAADFDEIKELDINPLLADADGVIAIDARIRFAWAARSPVPGARLAIKPYPSELRGEVTLRDGTRIAVRPIAPTDAPRLQEMIRRTDPGDIRMRFLHAMKQLPDKLAARLSQIDYAREMAFLAIDETDETVLGVSRLVADANNERAEYAVMVRTDWKGRGLGYGLMNRLIDHARGCGLRELFGEVLAENTRMLGMCRELGFEIKPSPDDRQLCNVRLDLAPG